MDIMRQSACLVLKVSKESQIRNRNNQVPHLTQDTTRERDKATFKVSKGAKIRNRYNQVPHLTQDTNRKVRNSQ